MSDGKVSQVRVAGSFFGGFLLGIATLSLFNNVSDLSPSSGAAPSSNRRSLLAVSDYADPRSIGVKAIMTDDGSLPRQEGEPLPDLGYPMRQVRVGTMCRCASGLLPIPGPLMPENEFDTQIVQPPSVATGPYGKRFIMHGSEEGCSCVEPVGRSPAAETTTDLFLKKMQPHECPRPHPARYEWENMPDLGVEENLPVFVGVLSYESPLSLNGTLHNWLDHDLFRRINAHDVFVQLNHRSQLDHEIMQRFVEEQRRRQQESPITVLGTPADNLHPGRAISEFCRRAEAHPGSHPNGENLLMFLEKDWNLYNGATDLPRYLEDLFRGINALAQRGVPYIRLKRKSIEVSEEKTWPCPAQGFPFECTTAHQHRWTNQPLVVRCDWFLRYLEPFALLDDPVMYGCRPGFQENRYCDWEEALQDGRIAWANSQWVVASLMTGKHRLFFHQEVDQ